MLLWAGAPPFMLGHLWVLLPDGDGAGVGVAALAAAVRAVECEVTVEEVALVEALAMVRPTARLAPSAPAPTAVPISDRLIRTSCSLPNWRPGLSLSPGTGPDDPSGQVRLPDLRQ